MRLDKQCARQAGSQKSKRTAVPFERILGATLIGANVLIAPVDVSAAQLPGCYAAFTYIRSGLKVGSSVDQFVRGARGIGCKFPGDIARALATNGYQAPSQAHCRAQWTQWEYLYDQADAKADLYGDYSGFAPVNQKMARIREECGDRSKAEGKRWWRHLVAVRTARNPNYSRSGHPSRSAAPVAAQPGVDCQALLSQILGGQPGFGSYETAQGLANVYNANCLR
jgi:hypothetical protein